MKGVVLRSLHYIKCPSTLFHTAPNIDFCDHNSITVRPASPPGTIFQHRCLQMRRSNSGKLSFISWQNDMMTSYTECVWTQPAIDVGAVPLHITRPAHKSDLVVKNPSTVCAPIKNSCFCLALCSSVLVGCMCGAAPPAQPVMQDIHKSFLFYRTGSPPPNSRLAQQHGWQGSWNTGDRLSLG